MLLLNYLFVIKGGGGGGQAFLRVSMVPKSKTSPKVPVIYGANPKLIMTLKKLVPAPF